MDHSLVVMAEMMPIVGFVGFITVAAIVGFMDGATTIGGGGTTVTGGWEVPIGGLLGGVVVIASDFLFLVVWSVNCAQYPIPCCLECRLCLISNSLLLFMYTQPSAAVGFSLVSQPSLSPALGPMRQM